MTSFLDKNEKYHLECLLKRHIKKSQIRKTREENTVEQRKELEIKNQKKNEELLQKQLEKEKLAPKTYLEAAKRSQNKITTNEKGRKLFVGKIKFNDLRGKEGLIFTRKLLIQQIFESFGEIESFRCCWERDYIFVVYKETNAASLAYDNLSDFNKKKAIIAKFKQDSISVPNSNFYVRWPK